MPSCRGSSRHGLAATTDAMVWPTTLTVAAPLLTGASGSYFYFTPNKHFIVKTVTKSEKDVSEA